MTDTIKSVEKKRINKLTRDKLIKLFEQIGYKVTNQSSNGIWKLLRYPNGESTGYYLFPDCIQHQLDEFRGCSHFAYKECFALCEDNETVAVVVKNIKNHSIFVQFHNFNKEKED